MSAIPARLQALVAFDHWSWLIFIVWFAVATVVTFVGSPVAVAITYWGVVAVLLNNAVRLLLLAGHFRSDRKPKYFRLTILLIVTLAVSILVQLWMHK